MSPDQKSQANPRPLIPTEMVEKWQRISNLMAQILEAPAALIMRFDISEIEVFVSSKTEGNPYEPGERAKLQTGLYCEWVREHRSQLYVPDARKDPVWDHNPDMPLGMVAYIGLPLTWPDGEVFGTICALDREENAKLLLYQDLLSELRHAVDADLNLAVMQAELEETNDHLAEALARLQVQHAELITANKTIEDMVASLERSNQELDDFAHIVAHDIKEPLRGIHQYANLIIEDHGGKLDDEGLSKLATIPRLTDRLSLFVESLLQYSRLGRTELGITETDFNKLVEEVLDSLHVLLEENGIDMRVHSPLPSLQCDQLRIGEVIRNLIVNAIKYNDKPNKLIEIGCISPTDNERPRNAPAGDYVFYVRDNGMGIPQKHLETVFQIFKQLHGRSKGGVGAGLTIVRKIVERHGGRIWAESTKGQGTTFYFSIPPLGQTKRMEVTRETTVIPQSNPIETAGTLV